MREWASRRRVRAWVAAGFVGLVGLVGAGSAVDMERVSCSVEGRR
jgi:hypothetical protein